MIERKQKKGGWPCGRNTRLCGLYVVCETDTLYTSHLRYWMVSETVVGPSPAKHFLLGLNVLDENWTTRQRDMSWDTCTGVQVI